MNIRSISEEQAELVLKNQNLVHHLVKNLTVSPSDYDDIVSIGTFGLIKAATTFDKSRGIKFATYAGTCINNEIFMHFRKEKSHMHDVSLSDSITNDGEGHDLTIGDTIPSSDPDFTEKIEECDICIRAISIILNLLKPQERLLMLYRIAGVNQKVIAKTLNLSQSYVSRFEKKLNKKIKSYLTTTTQFKEVFSMAIVNNNYQISFSSKDIKHFNEIFATLLLNLRSSSNLPNFDVDCNRDRIIIKVPAYPESFSFIAEIIKEIDNYSLTYVSNKYISPTDNSPKLKADDTSKVVAETTTDESYQETDTSQILEVNTLDSNPESTLESATVETLEAVPIIEDDASTLPTKGLAESLSNDSKKGESSKNKQVIDYLLSRTSVTVRELKEHFPSFSAGTINTALNFAKRKGLITATSRGNYRVNNAQNPAVVTVTGQKSASFGQSDI